MGRPKRRGTVYTMKSANTGEKKSAFTLEILGLVQLTLHHVVQPRIRHGGRWVASGSQGTEYALGDDGTDLSGGSG